jgi:hypothetical protein
VIELIIDAISSIVFGAVIAAIPAIRYHKKVVNELMKEKFEMAREGGNNGFAGGWDNSAEDVIEHLEDEDRIRILKEQFEK